MIFLYCFYPLIVLKSIIRVSNAKFFFIIPISLIYIGKNPLLLIVYTLYLIIHMLFFNDNLYLKLYNLKQWHD